MARRGARPRSLGRQTARADARQPRAPRVPSATGSARPWPRRGPRRSRRRDDDHGRARAARARDLAVGEQVLQRAAAAERRAGASGRPARQGRTSSGAASASRSSCRRRSRGRRRPRRSARRRRSAARPGTSSRAAAAGARGAAARLEPQPPVLGDRAQAAAEVERRAAARGAEREELRARGPTAGARAGAASSASRCRHSRASAGGSARERRLLVGRAPASTTRVEHRGLVAQQRERAQDVRLGRRVQRAQRGQQLVRARGCARTPATALRRVLAPRQPALARSTPRSPRA